MSSSTLRSTPRHRARQHAVAGLWISSIRMVGYFHILSLEISKLFDQPSHTTGVEVGVEAEAVDGMTISITKKRRLSHHRSRLRLHKWASRTFALILVQSDTDHIECPRDGQAVQWHRQARGLTGTELLRVNVECICTTIDAFYPAHRHSAGTTSPRSPG